ncbi:MAG: hypothetical protein K9J13_16170 [Saprospiraceae bacterium]|nr:hypothetical protein [Saprospiraceae bacterium]
MKSEIKQTVEIILTLTPQEAKWLKAYVQNPMCPPEEENKEDSKMREKIFDALHYNTLT